MFLLSSRELLTQVGVLRIKVHDGDMRNLKLIKKVLGGERRIHVPKQLAMERPQKGTLNKVISGRRRDQESMKMLKSQEMIIIEGKKRD